MEDSDPLVAWPGLRRQHVGDRPTGGGVVQVGLGVVHPVTVVHQALAHRAVEHLRQGADARRVVGIADVDPVLNTFGIPARPCSGAGSRSSRIISPPNGEPMVTRPANSHSGCWHIVS